MIGEDTRRGARGPGISLTVAPDAVRLAPDGRAELRLVVASTDPNASPTRYHLAVTGLQRLWYTLGETEILLNPGARETVLLTLHPVAGKAAPGRYPFRVKATWPANPSIAAAAVVTLTVAATEESGAALPAQPASAASAAAALGEQPAPPAARPATALTGLPAGQPVAGLAERPAAATRWTAAVPLQRKRIPLVAGLGVLLILLLGEGAVLASRLNAPRPASNRVAVPAATPTAPLLPSSDIPQRTPYGIVAGAVARAPVIQRFTVIRGGAGRPDTLVWQTANAAVVTLDGHAAPPRGTRVIQPSVYGSVYRLRARAGDHVATASVHAVAPNPIAVAASIPVALLNLTALRFPDHALGAAARVQTVHLVNLGPVPLDIARISVDGDRADFTVHALCARRTLPVDASCAIDVRFTPTQRGARHAILVIADNTAAGAERITLDGAGV